MTLKEVASLLAYSVDHVKKFISTGLKLPGSGKMAKLGATKVGRGIEVTDKQLNAFIRRFEAEEPGRWPPVEVRRELLVEANHLCAVCREALPPQFHHMLEWSKIRHHDPRHMLVLCGGCHDRCRTGEIDTAAQAMYKAKLLTQGASGQASDAHLAKKNTKDLKTLSDLLSSFPSSWADIILTMAQEDTWWYDRLSAFEGAERMVGSSLFFLYDKALWKLIKDFFAEWRRLNVLSMSLFHGGGGSGISRSVLDAFSPPWLQERYQQFQRHVAAARSCLAVLVAYIHEQYPAFDFEGIELHARESYRKMIMQIRRPASKKRSGPKRKK
jgi:hypothetical protein